MWKWSNYYCANTAKETLRVNLDETSICMFQGASRGNIFVSKREEPCERASLNERRSYLTHVGLVCDRAGIQPLLPQFLIGNERVLPAGQMAALRGACPPNVRLVRQKSSWNNTQLFCAIIRAVGKTLREVAPGLQPIFFFDAATIHIPPAVFRACRVAGMWPVVIPARATWLLQPLDTHVFKHLKAALRKACLEHRVLTEDGRLPIAGLLRCLCSAIGDVLGGVDWSSAFEHDGFSPLQAGLSERVRKHVGVACAVPAPADRPTADDLRCCFPANRRIPLGAIWSAFDTPVVGGAAAPSAGSAEPAPIAPAARLVADAPITRSMSRRMREAAAAEASGAGASSSV